MRGHLRESVVEGLRLLDIFDIRVIEHDQIAFPFPKIIHPLAFNEAVIIPKNLRILLQVLAD